MRQRYGYTEDEMVFGFVGRITKDKGVGELLEAFAAMESGAKLFVIGPREDAALWKRAEETENVTVAEAADEIERYYALMDVLVLPSHREGFGNVVAEAGAMGLAAIITDIPGPMDAVSPGQTALVVPPGDVQALRRAMETIRQRDYRAMGQQAAVLIRRRFDSDRLNREIYRRKCRLLAAEEKADGKAFGFNYHSGV